MDFWNWVDDSHHIPEIFDLLKKVNELFKYPYGRQVSKEVMKELQDGEIHLSNLFKKMGSNSHWFDDLFDINHKYPIGKNHYRHYGEWFVKLQTAFRSSTNSDSITD